MLDDIKYLIKMAQKKNIDLNLASETSKIIKKKGFFMDAGAVVTRRI